MNTRVAERRRIGGTAVEVTALSFGGAAIGGLYAKVPEDVAAAAVARALDRGIGYFDTAPHYGVGLSERRLGAALRAAQDAMSASDVASDAAPDTASGGAPGAASGARPDGASGATPGGASGAAPDGALGGASGGAPGGAGGAPFPAPSGAFPAPGRGSWTLSTKVGRLLRAGGSPGDEGFAGEPAVHRVWDFTADGVRRSLAESLERLGLDRVDIVYLHDPDDHEAEVYATGFPALAELRDEGVVGAIGAGMNQTAMLTRFVRRLDLDVVLCAGRYTLLDRSAAADLLPACLARGTSVVAGAPYNSGLLAGGTTYDYRPATTELLARVAGLREACESYGVPLRAAALRFPIRHPAVAAVLVGCRTPAEVDDNADMFEREIPDALWAELDELAGTGPRER